MRALVGEDVSQGCERACVAGNQTGRQQPEQDPPRGIRELALVALLYAAYTGSRLLAARDRAPALHRAGGERAFEEVAAVEGEGDGAGAVVAAVPPAGVAAAPDVGLAADLVRLHFRRFASGSA